MSKVKSPSFITELPLRVSPKQERGLLIRFNAAGQIYNACLGEGLKRLDLMRQSKKYNQLRKMPKGREKLEAFRALWREFGLSEYDLGSYAATQPKDKTICHLKKCWIDDHIDSQTKKKMASRAFAAIEQYAYNKRGKPKFKRCSEIDSVESINNKQGIIWREDRVIWKGLELEAIIDRDDPVIAHGLSCRVKYVRLARRVLHGRNRFYAQLVCEGPPYRNHKIQIGRGMAGIDIGPSTIAAVSENDAFLEQFCAELTSKQKARRHYQKCMDRRRRMNNPDNYEPNSISKKGKRKKGKPKKGKLIWDNSQRYYQIKNQDAEIQRKQAAHRKSLHGHLVNRIIQMGGTINLEKLSYVSFQKQYGKSVRDRAPGMFVSLLKRKAETYGVKINEFSTRTTKLSQTCHNCGEIVKKPRSQRWHNCPCGIEAQRDLYSAFLASCVEENMLNAGRAKVAWPGAEPLLQAALSKICESANGRRLPTSFGINQSMSRSPVKSSANAIEIRDVVTRIRPRESPGKIAGSLEPLRERRYG